MVLGLVPGSVRDEARKPPSEYHRDVTTAVRQWAATQEQAPGGVAAVIPATLLPLQAMLYPSRAAGDASPASRYSNHHYSARSV